MIGQWGKHDLGDGTIADGIWLDDGEGGRYFQHGEGTNASAWEDWKQEDTNTSAFLRSGFMGGRSLVSRDPGGAVENWRERQFALREGFDPYAYRTDRNKPPELADFFNAWNKIHMDQYGEAYNRPWDKHGESALRDKFVKQYVDAVAEYNQIHGTNLRPDQQALQNFGAAPTWYAASDPSESRSGGFFKSGLGQFVLTVGSIMGAPYLSAFLGGGLAGSAGTGAILGGGRAAATGGDVLQGALMGAAGGAASYGLSGATGSAGLDGSGASAEAWSDWGTSGPGWTSGGDLPVGGYTGAGGIPDAAAGGAEMWGGADMFGEGAGVDLSTADWVSGGDLATGGFTGGAGIPAVAGGGAAVAGSGGMSSTAATTAATTATGGAAATGGLTGNASVDSVIRGLSAAGIPQALIGSVVSNLVADGLFGAGDARDAAERYSNAAAAAIGQNQQITMEQYNRWKQQYAPLEDELIGQARRGMGNEEVDSIMGRINADATEQFGRTRENLSEEFRRRGIAPGSGAEILGLSELAASEAAAKNGAQTTAKEGIRQFN
ncbi:MAG: hypothetical protein K2W80_03530, partial [Burkholderiales bacterium]|nr:hypothetical protein [Burkholderiales bacterium]